MIPRTIDDVRPEWLTERLRAAGALGDREFVSGLSWGPIGVGIGVMALLYRITPTYEPPGAGPASLVAKVASLHEQTREVAAGYRFYEREAAFYARLAGDSELHAPHAYFAAHDPASGDFVVLMDDLSMHRVLDQVAGCPPDTAEAIVTVLARHHARWWNSPALLDFEFIQSPGEPPYPQFHAESTAQAWPVCLEVVGDLLPDSVREIGARWGEIGPPIMEMALELPWTFTHGDLRLDNVFFGDAPGDFWVVDWQICFRSGGATDVAYFLSQSLTVADRRAHENRLVRAYYDELVTGGVADYSFDDFWRDYRRMILFGFCYPMTAAGQLDLVNDRAVELVRTMTERAVAAIEDLAAVELAPV